MPNRPLGIRLWVALATVYLVWGSTYLAIAIGVETIPPFVMAAIRFAAAGAILIAWEVLRGGRGFRLPSAREWRDSAIVGTLLLGLGNGFVGIAEQTVPSGIAAILIGLVPAWFAILGWLYFRDRLPRLAVAGIVLGLLGVVVLVWPFGPRANVIDLAGLAILIVAAVSWAHGSIFSARRAKLPARPLMATGLQMLLGSGALFVEAALTGEFGRFDSAAVSGPSLAALTYLVLVGSLVGFNAYAWLLRHAPLSLAGTYAFVNPVVAVALGSLILAEPVSPRTLVASAVIVVAVAMIVTSRGRMTRVDLRERTGPSADQAAATGAPAEAPQPPGAAGGRAPLSPEPAPRP
jgi:drug/metabolite transporter (DMT)-like permease